MEGEVLFQLLLQAVVDVTRGDELTLLAEERRVVDAEEHRHGGFVDGDRRQGLGIFEVADGVANLEFLESDDGTDVATVDAVGAHVAHALEGVEFLDFRLLHGAVAMGNGDLLTVAEGATMDAAHGDTAGVGAIVERGDEHLRCALQLLRSRDDFDDFIQEIGDVGSGFVEVLAHPAVLGRAIDNGEVELVLGGIEREHEVEHHFVNLLRAAVGLIDLVDHHDGLEANLEGLLEHETRLGHRSLEGIDEEQTSVGHVEHALYLASEVGVSRGVDDVDFRSFPINTDIF